MVDSLLAAYRKNQPETGEQIVRRALGWLPPGGERVIANIVLPGGQTLGEGVRAWEASEKSAEAVRPALTPVVGGLMAARDQAARPFEALTDAATNWLPAGLPRDLARVPFNVATAPITMGANPDAAPPSLTPEGLSLYAREQAKRAPMGEFALEEATDIRNFIPFGRGARTAVGIGQTLAKQGPRGTRLLGSGLETLGRATLAYDDATNAVLPLLGKGIKAGAMKTPVAKWLLAPSIRSETEQAVARGGEAVLAGSRGVAESRAARAKAGETLTGSAVEEFVLPGQVRRQPGRRVWGQVGEELSAYEDKLLALDGGARQQAGAMVYAEVQRRKNLLERDANRRISEIRDGLTPRDGAAPQYLPDEAKALINGEYDQLAEGVLTTIRAGDQSLDEIATMDFPKLSGEEDAAIAGQMADTVSAIRNAATEARDIAKALRGKGFMEGEGVFDLADPEELVQAIAAEDNAYNAARKTIDAALAQTGGLAMAGAPERNAAVAKQVNAALEFYRTRAGDLTLLSRPMSARAAGVAQTTRQTLTNEQETLTRAAKAVRGDADAIRTLAVPLLAQHYRAQINGITVPALLEAMAPDLIDSQRMLKTLDGMVGAGQAPAQTVAKIRERVTRWGDVGDVLRERDFFYLMMHDYGKAEALARGEKAPNALLGAYFAATGVWRDTALLSPRFHITNAIYMLWASHKAGYSPAPIVNAWQRNMADVWRQLRTDPETGKTATAGQTLRRIFDEDRIVVRTAKETMQAQADWGFEDEAGNVILDQRLERRNTAGVSGPGGLEGGSSTIRRIVGRGVGGNVASGAIGATIGGVSGALHPAESEEQRRLNILKGAAPGALVGASLPTAIWASKLMGQVVERGGRMHVYDEAMQRAMVGGGDELDQFMRVHTAKPREAIARPLMRDGAEVRTIEDLLGAGFTMPGAPEGATTLGSWPRGAARRPDEVLPEVGPTVAAEPDPRAIMAGADPETRAALTDLVSKLRAWETAQAAGGPDADALRQAYEASLAGADAGTRALHQGMRGAGAPPVAPVRPAAATADDLLATEGDQPAWAMTREEFGQAYPPDELLSDEELAEEGAEWLRAQRGFGQGPGLHRLEPSDEGSVPIFYNDAKGNAVAMATVMGAGPGKTPWVESLAIDSTRGLLSARAAKAVLGEVAKLGPVRVRTTLSPKAADLLHRAVVERAAAQGKAIPAAVLATYPRLKVTPAPEAPFDAGEYMAARRLAPAAAAQGPKQVAFRRTPDSPLDQKVAQQAVDDVNATGLVDEIERLFAEGKTPREIADIIDEGGRADDVTSTPGALVRAVRDGLDIPHYTDARFTAWQADYHARQPQPTPTAPAAPGRPNPLIPPSPTGAPGVYADMQAGPTILPGKASDEQMASMLAWRKSKGDRFSPLDVRREAIARGVDQDLAEDWAGEWARRLKVGQDAGIAADNVVNFDYSDTSRLTEFLRRSGIFPFITFPIKALPQVATWMIQDPRLFIAWDKLNNLSEDDIAESGLSPKFARLARLGTLGDELAAQMLGRPDATLMGQPWSLLIPYAEIGRPPRPAYGEQTQQPIEAALDTAGSFGASLGPVPSLLGRLTGATPDLGGSLLRTSPYAEALSAGMGGDVDAAAIDPELPIKQGIAAIRGAITGERTTTLSGHPMKDYYIRQMIAEEALTRTGKPPTGDYKSAMDDPKSAIWKRAQRAVERQMAGQTALSATLPFRTRALTEAQETVSAAQLAEGMTPGDLAAMTPEDRRAAISAAYKRQSAGVGLWGLGGSDEQIAKRQMDGYIRENARWKRMDPRRRAAARKAYLEDKPQLRRYLAETNEFG